MQDRLEGRLLCSTIARRVTELYLFQMERAALSVCMPVFWFVTSPFCFYKINEGSDYYHQEVEWESNNLLGRHTDYGPVQGRVGWFKRHTDLPPQKPWVCSELQKISIRPLSGDRVLGLQSRFCQVEGLSYRRENREDSRSLSIYSKSEDSFSQGFGQTSRDLFLNIHGSDSSPSKIQGNSTPINSRSSYGKILRGFHNLQPRFQKRNKLVDSAPRKSEWPRFINRTTTNDHSVGCIKIRLGGSLSGSISRGPVVREGASKTYQYTGAESSSHGCIDFLRETKTVSDPFTNGQYISTDLYSEDGGYSELGNVSDKQGTLDIFIGKGDHDYCRIPAGEAQWLSGLGVSQGGQERLEITPGSISDTLLEEGSARSRSLCIKGDDPSEQFFLVENRLYESRNRCLSTELVKHKRVCLPTVLSNRESLTEGSFGEGRSVNNNTCLAIPVVVPLPDPNVSKESNSYSKVSGSTKKSSRGISSIGPKQFLTTGGMNSVLEKLLAEEISRESAELVLHARRKGTRSHYESAWRKFSSWCFKQKTDPFGCSLALILQFLTDQFKQGREYNTIAGYRSAISAFHLPIAGCKVGVHPQVSALLKGIYNKNPPRPRYSFIWDVDKVLHYLDNMPCDDNLNNLTHKLTMLLALTSASRASEIHQLDLKYMVKTSTFCRFTLAQPTKTQVPGKPHPVLSFYSFDENKNLCVCTTINDYLRETKSIRGSETNLLIATVKPHKRVAVSTVSRWLKEVIRKSGIDTDVFGGHSTRSAATSKAILKGASIEDVMNTAYWANESTFQKYYNKSCSLSSSSFQEAVFHSFEQR